MSADAREVVFAVHFARRIHPAAAALAAANKQLAAYCAAESPLFPPMPVFFERLLKKRETFDTLTAHHSRYLFASNAPSVQQQHQRSNDLLVHQYVNRYHTTLQPGPGCQTRVEPDTCVEARIEIEALARKQGWWYALQHAGGIMDRVVFNSTHPEYHTKYTMLPFWKKAFVRGADGTLAFKTDLVPLPSLTARDPDASVADAVEAWKQQIFQEEGIFRDLPTMHLFYVVACTSYHKPEGGEMRGENTAAHIICHGESSSGKSTKLKCLKKVVGAAHFAVGEGSALQGYGAEHDTDECKIKTFDEFSLKGKDMQQMQADKMALSQGVKARSRMVMEVNPTTGTAAYKNQQRYNRSTLAWLMLSNDNVGLYTDVHAIAFVNRCFIKEAPKKQNSTAHSQGAKDAILGIKPNSVEDENNTLNTLTPFQRQVHQEHIEQCNNHSFCLKTVEHFLSCMGFKVNVDVVGRHLLCVSSVFCAVLFCAVPLTCIPVGTPLFQTHHGVHDFAGNPSAAEQRPVPVQRAQVLPRADRRNRRLHSVRSHEDAFHLRQHVEDSAAVGVRQPHRR